jgi:regulation of enolase protein 1 (concanavalin A-like superfamily)
MKSNYVYYKVAKAGNVITLYYSGDGAQYYLIRHLQFDNARPWQVGFLSQSPTGDRCEVHFSEIKFLSYTIRDPYLGE